MTTNEILESLGFNVLANIGQGSFGTVKLAKSKRFEKQVAIKVLDLRLATPSFVRKFLPREIAILRRIRHPHIIQVHEIFKVPSKQVYIVMEAAVMDLQEKLQQSCYIRSSQAKKWFSQLLSAVVYLHQQDIVHRDLKCENVLLTAENQVKLTDFGFGRFSRGFPQLSETYCCTRQYAAPEVLMRKPYDPKKSDVWSLGVILYAMVTGSMPFKYQGCRRLLQAQSKPLVYPCCIKVQKQCRNLISYMLHFDPATRPTATEVAQHPWLQPRQKCSRRLGLWVRSLGCFKKEKEKNVEEEGSPSREPHASTSGKTPPPMPLKEESPSSSTLSGEVDAPSPQGFRCESVVPELDDDSSGAGASVTCPNVEVVGEEHGCCSCSALCAAVKAHVVAPILRASRSLRERVRKCFRRNSVVHVSSPTSQQDARHPVSTCAPASSSSEQRQEDVSDVLTLSGEVVEEEAVEAEPTVRQGARKPRFPKFKV
ncbi:testis-specific serine/threonine-protein kinase 6-like [Salminus brasiliensis]|uniref:testis-specific serine/threonine-protein kinase 6-like n=1 Tax=Salminus brasiliensis TaxID=930266 RepID=UPI003B82F2A3